MTVLAPKKEYTLPDVSALKFDEKKHAYSKDGRLFSGVTTVISETSSKGALVQWAANMAVDYVKEVGTRFENELVDAGTGESLDGTFYRIYEGQLEEARKAHARRRDGAATKGTDTHALVEEYINLCLEQDGSEGVPVSYDDLLELELPAEVRTLSDVENWNKGVIRPFVEWACSNVDRFLAAEQRLYSETHGFAGTCDFIAIIDGKLTIGDLKTFPKMWSADAFIQMGAYSLAFTELTGERPEQSVVVKMCDPNDERLKKYGGNAFSVYPRYALTEDEEMFLLRLKMYRYNENFVSPKN